MNTAETTLSGRSLKREVHELLGSDDWTREMASLLGRVPAQKLLSPLFASLCDREELVKWRGVACLGMAVEVLARQSMESARVVMRRLMWSLNDESGGIGWGAPEAMGEIMARNPRLADEFASILMAYLHEREDGRPDCYLELDQLRKGVVWGLGRLAQASPDHVRGAAKDLVACLDLDDPDFVGRAAWVLGLIREKEARAGLIRALSNRKGLSLFRNGEMESITVEDLVREALLGMGAE